MTSELEQLGCRNSEHSAVSFYGVEQSACRSSGRLLHKALPRVLSSLSFAPWLSLLFCSLDLYLSNKLLPQVLLSKRVLLYNSYLPSTIFLSFSSQSCILFLVDRAVSYGLPRGTKPFHLMLLLILSSSLITGSCGFIEHFTREMATHSSVLAWRIPWRNLVGYSPWGRKESDTTEWLASLSLPGKLECTGQWKTWGSN